MRGFAALSLLMFCLFSVGQAQTTEAPVQLPSNAGTSREWIKYSDTPGRFTVMMPIQPEKSENPVETQGGKLTNHIFLAKTAVAAFALSYTDYAETSEPAKVLERVRDGAIQGIKGTLVSSSSISHKSFPGLEFQASLAGALYTSRIYLVKARLYQMVVVAAPGAVPASEINRFLTSFDLPTNQ